MMGRNRAYQQELNLRGSGRQKSRVCSRYDGQKMGRRWGDIVRFSVVSGYICEMTVAPANVVGSDTKGECPAGYRMHAWGAA